MQEKKLGAIIPIRLASERLPNKAIKEICGRPVVWHLLDRVCVSKHIQKSDVVVCTTQEKSDDSLEEIVKRYGCSVFRGSTDDIIKRFYEAVEFYGFDAVIQVDGDDILCDTQYMDLTMDKLLEDPTLDIVTCEELPLGIASKSFTRRAMERVYRHYKTEKNDTGFIYFFTKTSLCKKSIIHPIKPEHVLDEARLTLDYEEDFEVFRIIIEALYREGRVFGLEEIVLFLRQYPGVMKINAVLNEKYMQRHQEKAQLLYEDDFGLGKKIES
jgi:spore coat polysaccharide biosynthesis protein SpsF